MGKREKYCYNVLHKVVTVIIVLILFYIILLGVNNVINEKVHSSEPKPMGIADFGLSTSILGGLLGYNSYSYNTPIFMGNIDIISLLTYNSSNSVRYGMSFQLNVILVFYNSGQEYVYWIQDAAYVNTAPSQHILFFDNVWNDSSSSAKVLTSTILGNGTVSKHNGIGYYSCTANPSLPSNNINFSFPTIFSLKVISGITSSNQPTVAFL